MTYEKLEAIVERRERRGPACTCGAAPQFRGYPAHVRSCPLFTWRSNPNDEADRDVEALVAAVRELRTALAATIDEIREHNREYHHVTPDEKIEGWRLLLEPK